MWPLPFIVTSLVADFADDCTPSLDSPATRHPDVIVFSSLSLQIYCQSHVPKTIAPTLDGSSVGIKQALNVPKTDRLVNDQIRGSGKGTFDVHALVIKSALSTPKPHSESDCQRNPIRMAGNFDASALHIQHGIKATKLQRSYKSDGRKIHDFLVST